MPLFPLRCEPKRIDYWWGFSCECDLIDYLIIKDTVCRNMSNQTSFFVDKDMSRGFPTIHTWQYSTYFSARSSILSSKVISCSLLSCNCPSDPELGYVVIACSSSALCTVTSSLLEDTCTTGACLQVFWVERGVCG